MLQLEFSWSSPRPQLGRPDGLNSWHLTFSGFTALGKSFADPLSRRPMFAGAVTRAHTLPGDHIPQTNTHAHTSLLPATRHGSKVLTVSEMTDSSLYKVNQPSSELVASNRPSQPVDVPRNLGSGLIARNSACYTLDWSIAEHSAWAGGKLKLVEAVCRHGNAVCMPDAPGLRAPVIREHLSAHAGHPGLVRVLQPRMACLTAVGTRPAHSEA